MVSSTDPCACSAGAQIENCLDFLSSDASLDRYGEIITPGGWDLRNYLRNPVFQNAHQYGDIIFTLGRALITEVRSATAHSAHLYQRVQFAVDANPLAKIAHALYAGKFLNAVSVGFIPRRWQDPAGPDHEVGRGVPGAPGTVQPAAPEPGEGGSSSSLGAPKPGEGGIPSEGPAVSGQLCRGLGGAAPRRIYLEQELLEVSAVSIPANPNALALAVKSGAIEKSDLKNTADLINYTLAAGPAVSSSALRTPHSALLGLARQIRAQLKRL